MDMCSNLSDMTEMEKSNDTILIDTDKCERCRPSAETEIFQMTSRKYHKTRCSAPTNAPILTLEATFKIVSLFLAILMILPVSGLANCPNGCECDDETLIVTCGEGTLDVLPIALNPSIQRLAIKNNKIKTIDSSIQFYAALTFLDLSYNDLVNIPHRTFAFQRQLQELHLKNNKIGQISNKTFVGLSSLNILNLRGNLIAELEYGTFAPMTKITFLDLGQNRISTIDPHAFDGLRDLKQLYLDDNTLTTVPTDVTFKAMPALSELYLGTNSFMSLPAAAFSNLPNLKRLDLRGAGLHNLSVDALENLESLQYLDLADNRLVHVPSAALSRLRYLEELSIGQNDFEIIPTGALLDLKNLKRLHVTGAMRLRRIEHNAFQTNTNLEYLNFSSNRMLTEIDANAFNGLMHLRVIILKENQLSTLNEGVFPWAALENLDLSNNPFKCDCQMLWLHNLLLAKNISANGPSSVICASPEKLRDKPLASVTPVLLGCTQTDVQQQALIGVVLLVVALIVGLLAVIYIFRRKIREVLRGKWGNTALGHKEQEYQKTFSDEEYMTRQQPHSCSFATQASAPYVNAGTYNPHAQSGYMGTCPIPVTEL